MAKQILWKFGHAQRLPHFHSKTPQRGQVRRDGSGFGDAPGEQGGGPWLQMDDPAAAGFTFHGDGLGLQVDLLPIEPHYFFRPDAGKNGQHEVGAASVGDNFQEHVYLIWCEDFRRIAISLDALDAFARIDVDVAAPNGEREQSADPIEPCLPTPRSGVSGHPCLDIGGREIRDRGLLRVSGGELVEIIAEGLQVPFATVGGRFGCQQIFNDLGCVRAEETSLVQQQLLLLLMQGVRLRVRWGYRVELE